jgi:curved DNA-binding protein CbpA
MAGQATGAATTDGSAQPSSAKTHYDILGVSRTATCEEIKAAYHNLARRIHPDKVSSNGSQDSFRRLQSAWECLRQAETRQAYDEQLFLNEQKVESKRQAAMTLSLSKLEVGHDDESDEHVYIYTCRCGEELQIWQDEMPPLNESFLTECSGCSFSYSVMNDLFK